MLSYDILETYHGLNEAENDERLERDLAGLFETAQNIKLLALNASIEAMHAAAFIDGFSHSVGESLLGQADILRRFIESEGADELASLSMDSGLCDYAVADADGVITHSDDASVVGTVLDAKWSAALNDPKAMLIARDDARSNGRQYIGAARCGANGAGAVRLGQYFTPPRGATTIESFKVVAVEVKNQADALHAAVASTSSAIRDLMAEVSPLERRRGIRRVQLALSSIIRTSRVISLLGVRAKIEAAQMINSRAEFDKLSNSYLTLEARLMARLFAVDGADCALAYSVKETTGIGIWITDGNGVVEITNSDGDIGFTFVNGGSTAPFYPILKDPTYVAAPPPVTRQQDGKTFKFVGVARLDKPGIVQVGIPSDIFNNTGADGFMLVATEIRDMADRLAAVAEELSVYIEDI